MERALGADAQEWSLPQVGELTDDCSWVRTENSAQPRSQKARAGVPVTNSTLIGELSSKEV